MNRYIFTVTAGRSGQNTLTKLMETYVENSYVAFEQPQINYVFRGIMSNVERRFRRKFVETHELLGRGKILASFENGNTEYIEFYNHRRFHETLDYKKPMDVYQESIKLNQNKKKAS